jgi:hypothetical protein
VKGIRLPLRRAIDAWAKAQPVLALIAASDAVLIGHYSIISFKREE